jgi:uncharacterized SAM-binding protein YcdF (DUF218 family)
MLMSTASPEHTQNHITLRRQWLAVPGGLALLLVTLILAYQPILFAIGDFLVVKEDNLQPADMIHVLGGDFDRLDYAVELYHQGYAPRLFVTGCDYIAYKERAVVSGVRPEDIFPDSSWSATTYEEALELKEFLDSDASIQSVIVASDPYHMRRARWTFRWVLGDQVSIQMAPVPFNLSPYQRRWWTDANSWQYVKNEYLKIAYYYARYQLSAGLLGK